jgi:hypothetical protein
MCAVVLLLTLGAPPFIVAQDAATPALRAGSGAETIRLDGILNEPAWTDAELTGAFAQTDPSEGAPASFPTTVRVLAGRNALVIGITCSDADPTGIVSFNVRRDAPLGQEDHVRIVRDSHYIDMLFSAIGASSCQSVRLTRAPSRLPAT